jgi:mono/diheme cytochrome c family protein
MLKKILKWIGIVLGVLVVLLIIGAGVLYFRAQSRFNQKYTVQVEQVAIPTDAESIARGQHFANIYCAGCHGPDLGGTEFFSDPALGAVHAKNITRGNGGVGTYYTDADYIRTLRHGVNPEGASVFIMPANNFYHLSDEDLGDIIAYLKAAPPVDRQWAPRSFGPMGYILGGLGVFDSFYVAEQINHTAPRPVAPAVGVTSEYGSYLVTLSDCRTCHGQDLAGGRIPDPTISVIAPNITPGGEPGLWTEQDFINTIRTGVNPAGHALDPNVMPWKDYAQFSDDELKAIWTYIHGLPKLPSFTP